MVLIVVLSRTDFWRPGNSTVCSSTRRMFHVCLEFLGLISVFLRSYESGYVISQSRIKAPLIWSYPVIWKSSWMYRGEHRRVLSSNQTKKGSFKNASTLTPGWSRQCHVPSRNCFEGVSKFCLLLFLDFGWRAYFVSSIIHQWEGIETVPKLL